MSEQNITVGMRGVGSVAVDGSTVRGVGGALRPQLVVPLAFRLNPREADSKIAITWLGADLGKDQYVSTDQRLGLSVSEELTDGFPISSQNYVSVHQVNLHFRLTFAEIENVERHRQATRAEGLTLYIRLAPTVAAIRVHNDPGQAATDSAWSPGEFGLFAEVMPFWHAQIHPLPVTIETSTWVDQVLPGLGYDRLRLVEVAFPPPLPEHSSAAREWDKARRALDERRYGDAISECRDILSLWKDELGATKATPVMEVISSRRGWTTDDGRRGFLDSLWKSAVDLANCPHHPEGRAVPQEFSAADARLMLLLTASLSEYVFSAKEG